MVTRTRLVGLRPEICAITIVVTLLSGCANKTLSNNPLSYYSPPTTGSAATIVGEQHRNHAVFIQSVFSDQLPAPADSATIPVRITAGETTIGIAYADWKHVAGTIAFFKAEADVSYQVRVGINNEKENALNKLLGYGQTYVWIEEKKTGKNVSEKIAIHPSVPDRNTSLFMLLIPKK